MICQELHAALRNVRAEARCRPGFSLDGARHRQHVGALRRQPNGNLLPEAARRTCDQSGDHGNSPCSTSITADLYVLAEVRALAAQVTSRRDRLDVLVLNAAVGRPRREMTADGFEMDFATNHLSPFLLIALLSTLLAGSAPSRVVVISSSGHRHVRQVDLDALPTGRDFHHLRTYSTTKLLNLLFVADLSRRCAGSGVTANAADPGFVRTALGREAPRLFGLFLKAARPFQRDPRRAVETPLALATAPDLQGVSGRYVVDGKPVTPSPLALDRELAQRLWHLSEQLTVGPGGAWSSRA